MARQSATQNYTKTEIWNKDLAEGATIEGFYVRKEEFTTQYGDSVKYVIETKDGTEFGIYGSATLDRQFKNVPEGCYVWVIYDGEVKSKNGRTVKQYSVDYDPELVK